MAKQNSDYLRALRHTANHILMQAMEEIWPGKIIKALGPPTENGFYFDFEARGLKISPDDFPRIEKKMRQIVQQDLPLIRKELAVEKARKLFSANPYKQEWLEEIEQRGEKAVVYYTGDPKNPAFVDLCAGPHLQKTGQVKAFKLLRLTGAYWRGDEKNKMLTRIYGTAFPSQKQLDQYLAQLGEVKRRDHRHLGRELDLFSFHPEAPGDVFWHHNGYVIFKELVKFWREIHQQEGYQEIRTPEIMTKDLWQRSGHLANYGKKIYRVKAPGEKGWNLAIKPMNCNGAILIYKLATRSYRDLPLRLGELGIVHRYESAGEIHGIMRSREFTQDDAHIFCRPDQIKEELKRVISLCYQLYNTFGLKLDHIELSTRPEKSIGSDEIWERAEVIMRQILKEEKVNYQINKGEGAFYGPKIDFHLSDSLGRTWQCGTIQLDFAQPVNFELEYITQKGTRERPVMIHRVLYGSIERFLGILIEHYGGAFPVWLAPVQTVVLPITAREMNYARQITKGLKRKGLRVKLDDGHQTLSYRIRHWEIRKAPYILVVGEREMANKTVNLRQRGKKQQKEIKLEEFRRLILKQWKNRSLKLEWPE